MHTVDLSGERSRLRHSHRRYLIEFIDTIPQQGRLLDVGCGTGKTIRLIRKFRPDIHISAMDMDDYSPSLPSDVDFVIAQVDEIASQYAPASFDAVICQHVIEHLVYPTEMIQGIRSVLKTGGRVYIETPNWTRLLVPFSNLWFWNDYSHTRPYSRAALHRLFEDYRFRINAIRTLSSCSWFLRKTVQKAGAEGKKDIRIPQQLPQRGIVARISARLLNPLLRDVLVGISEKPD
jgi:SAM-dependent methyltransferase